MYTILVRYSYVPQPHVVDWTLTIQRSFLQAKRSRRRINFTAEQRMTRGQIRAFGWGRGGKVLGGLLCSDINGLSQDTQRLAATAMDAYSVAITQGNSGA